MQESDISAKARQSRFSDPLSLQSKQLQPDYVSSYKRINPFPQKLQLSAKKRSGAWLDLKTSGLVLSPTSHTLPTQD
jgi:hypothetical protein